MRDLPFPYRRMYPLFRLAETDSGWLLRRTTWAGVTSFEWFATKADALAVVRRTADRRRGAC